MRPPAVLRALLLFLSFVFVFFGASAASRESVAVFKGGATQIPFAEDNKTISLRTARGFRAPAFVGETKFLLVLCLAQFVRSSGAAFTAPVLRTSYANHKEWSAAQSFARDAAGKEKKHKDSESGVVWGNVTAVMSGEKIFVLATRLDHAEDLQNGDDKKTSVWETVMFVGTVVKPTDSSGGGATVTWEEEKSLKSLLDESAYEPDVIYIVGGAGNGVVTKNGTIILPVQITYANHFNSEASSIIYSTDDGETWQLRGPTLFLPTSECSVVEWSDEKLLLSLRFDWGVRAVFESVDMGATWTLSPIFMAVWGNDFSRSHPGSQGSVITAPVDGEDVLLFSHPLNTEKSRTRDTLQLWMSDGKRIRCVGTISANGKGEHTGNSILAHVGGHLYVTHEINPIGSLDETVTAHERSESSIAITPLPQLFESAKETARAWRRLDKSLQSKGIPTDALVGYLGNTEKDSAVWTDSYKCVDATVHGGERVAGGFRFSGKAGSGATWPVISQGQNQIYTFTRDAFTLAATVTIHAEKDNGHFELLSASSDPHHQNTVIGIGYTQEQQWYTVSGNGVKNITAFSFALDTAYHVAVTFADGVAFVFVNGRNITSGTQTADRSAWIDHFRIGRACTVRHAMLFSRRLDEAEIARLSRAGQREREGKTESGKEGEKESGKEGEKESGKEREKESGKEREKESGKEREKESGKEREKKSAERAPHKKEKGKGEKEKKGADGAAGAWGFGSLMCFVCSVIVLAVF